MGSKKNEEGATHHSDITELLRRVETSGMYTNKEEVIGAAVKGDAECEVSDPISAFRERW